MKRNKFNIPICDVNNHYRYKRNMIYIEHRGGVSFYERCFYKNDIYVRFGINMMKIVKDEL